jgi:hypothetical protein
MMKNHLTQLPFLDRTTRAAVVGYPEPDQTFGSNNSSSRCRPNRRRASALAESSSGAEGSLALLQALGYPFKDGKSESVDKREIVVRYFAGSNPDQHFFHDQAQIDHEAETLGLSKDFSGHN